MNNKYFTPDIEDIRVGYEYEVDMFSNGWEKEIFGDSPSWTQWYEKDGFTEALSSKRIRTPYLTKEQIEAEGWKLSKYSMLFADFSKEDFQEDYYAYLFTKDNYTLVYNTENKILSIVITDPSLGEDSDLGKIPIFRGECKSINEFRTIIKLLNIK